MRLQQMNQDRSPSRCETVISLACKLGMVVFVGGVEIMTQSPCPVPIYSVMEPVMQAIVVVNGLLNLKMNCVYRLCTQFSFKFYRPITITMSCMPGYFHITAHMLCTQFSFKFHLLNLLTMSCMMGCFHTTAALPIHSVHTTQFSFKFNRPLTITMSCMTGCFHITAHILCTQFSFKFHLLNLLTMSYMTGCFHTTAAQPIHSVHTTQFSFKFHLLNLLTISCMTGCFHTPGICCAKKYVTI